MLLDKYTDHTMLIRHLVSCRGTDEFLGVNDRVTFINSTLGKALGGAAGTELVLAFLMQGYTIKLKLKKLVQNGG